MNSQESLRELDYFCAKTVMEWPECIAPINATFPCFINWGGCIMYHKNVIEVEMFSPTSDAKSALSVLKCCAEKLGEDGEAITVQLIFGKWELCKTDGIESDKCAEADTLELAICLLARKLYSK